MLREPVDEVGIGLFASPTLSNQEYRNLGSGDLSDDGIEALDGFRLTANETSVISGAETVINRCTHVTETAVSMWPSMPIGGDASL